jgi:hypothetical protein
LSHVEAIAETAVFNAPASAVWNVLIDWAAIIDWMPDGYIQGLECDGRGQGAVRHLVTGQGARLSERLDRADESSGELELSMVGPLPWGLLSYAARGTLEALPGSRTRLTWRGQLETPDNGPECQEVALMLRKSYAKMLQGIREVVES